MSDETRDEVTATPETAAGGTPTTDRPGAYTGTGEGSKAPLVPKNVQRLATRTLILLLVVTAIVFGLQKWQSLGGDLDAVGGAETKDSILALHLLDEGSQVVTIDKSGRMVESAGYNAGTTDRDAVWNPSGNRVFFVSDREPGTTHIYRWNPDANKDPKKMTVDASSRGEISFPRGQTEKADDSALVATRGNIEEFFAAGETKSLRILPPTAKEIGQGSGEEGAAGAFEMVYKSFGISFRAGRWCKGKSMIAAIMRRDEDRGEILVMQALEPDASGALPRPIPIIAGERIEMDVSPTTGDLVFSVAGFDYPTDEQLRAATKNGKVQRPFRNVLALLDLSDAGSPKVQIVAASPNNDVAFGAPVFSPDGASLLVAAGTWSESSLKPTGLIKFPAKEQGGAQGVAVVRGEIFEPSWSPTGDKIVYVRRQNGRREIFVAGPDGLGETSITGDKGDFAWPHFSPQK